MVPSSVVVRDAIPRSPNGKFDRALLREEFRKLPDGTQQYTAWIDRDPGAETDEPVPVRMT